MSQILEGVVEGNMSSVFTLHTYILQAQFEIWTQLRRGVIDKGVVVLNEKEAAIVMLLRKNPFLTQQDMADQLEMSRPALANLISGLMRRGVITGRAYILSEDNEVVCIGGANVDESHLKEATQLGTSNPSAMSVAVGGVARNIADNLGRLDPHFDY